MKYFLRNFFEFAILLAFWQIELLVFSRLPLAKGWMILLVLIGAWAKSAFFGIENLQELWNASRRNVPYYRFMLIMLVNMSQMVTSFAFDYHCLQTLDNHSYGNIASDYSSGELLFECFYFSVLNFSFFGYGDVTPQTVPAKLLTMTEIVLAFVTVIFLLSDFISLKESLRRAPNRSDGGSGDI